MITFENDRINFDPADVKGMRELMQRADEFRSMLIGHNYKKERVTLSINDDNITTITYQKNGYARENVYWKDGTCEELFERWK